MEDEPEIKPAKLIIEVTAGIIPGEPMEEYTRRWTFSSRDIVEVGWEVSDAMGAALNYAANIAHPGQVNWVRHDWIWL